jgi:WW domain-containing oxidoreductase
VSLFAKLKPRGNNGLGYASTAEEATAGVSLAGKTVLITGANSGLGRESLRVLSLRGARIFAVARSSDKAAETLRRFGVSGEAFACDLAEPDSVRACAAQIKACGVQLDVILCNAGIMAPPELRLACGYELQFFTNHIGHFLLTTNLLDQLSETGRVVVLSSIAHRFAPPGGIQFNNLRGERGYQSWLAYGQSKFANLLFVKELARRFRGTRRTANALHPGIIDTNLGRHQSPGARFVFGLANPLMLKTVSQGAATQCYLAASPDVAQVSGEYFVDCQSKRARRDAENADLARRLWEVSEEIVARF